MECRETQTLLTAFHDGELPADGRARVEEHLRGCPECAALLADLARVDRAAGVPDPGPAYWDRFNARVMDRVERAANGPEGRVLRPKGGWMREQFRYLVPAAAVAALVVGIVYYGGMRPGAPPPAAPPAANVPATPDSAGERMANAEPESGATKTAEGAAAARPVPPPAPAKERVVTVTREERNRLADRSLPEGDGVASRDRAAAPADVNVPSPPAAVQRPPDGQGRPGAGAGKDATGSVAPAAGSPAVAAADGMTQGSQAERKKMGRATAPMEEPQGAGKATSASGMGVAKEPSPGSPCELARALAERERFRGAEDAQRACLSGDLDAPSREKGLVFLAELLDRQERFAEADAVIADVDRRFPQSRPLELYRQQRPMVQRQPKAVPVTR
ncbi:MAG: zf-HC2 domain-containing protein [Deltaproteobacteria bacterium]|nr:zf-HC2 domain-containing protein [Candidatus Deferrimicrobium borealis]